MWRNPVAWPPNPCERDGHVGTSGAVRFR